MISDQYRRKLLETMILIRTAEEKIVEVYAKDQQMRTPTHLSIGQEAVAAGLAIALKEGDQVFTGHRCHAAYLAKGGDYNAFFAELCGRATGVSAGRAGSAHLTDPDVGIFSSPILSAMIPVAVGAALSFKMDKSDNVAVSVFGDGAIEEGAFAESLNLAVTKQVPVLFVCENNLYSTHSPLSVRQPKSQIYQRVTYPDIISKQIDGNDATLVYTTLKEAIEHIRRTHQPVFIECLTYRVREHVGPLFDYDRGYRTKEEVDQWIAKCPINRLSKQLIDKGVLSKSVLPELMTKYKLKADEAYTKALQAPWPHAQDLLKSVY